MKIIMMIMLMMLMEEIYIHIGVARLRISPKNLFIALFDRYDSQFVFVIRVMIPMSMHPLCHISSAEL
jgi:hypothetical protein